MLIVALSAVSLVRGLSVSATAIAAQVPPIREPIASVARLPSRLISTIDDLSGEAIADVEIFEESSNYAFLTSASGSADLVTIAPKGGKIHVRKTGFEEQTLSITMAPADTAPITVRMKRVAKLPTVVTTNSAPKYVSPLLRGFEERRKTAAFGYFIDEAALRKDDTRPLANVLAAQVAGSIIKPISSANFLVRSVRCSTGGEPDVYLDGTLLPHIEDTRWKPTEKPRPGNVPPHDASEYPFDLNQFRVEALAGVEYYPDKTTLPVQFNRGRGCGALLLWTRER
jgi:hypothetical protein